jgi:hypothetical protein
LDQQLDEIGQNMQEGWSEFKSDVNKTIDDIRQDLDS